MSGSYNYLTALFSASIGATDPILGALYGANGTGAQDPAQALQQAQQNKTPDLNMTAAEPQVQVAIKQFTQAVNSATSLTQLLSNPSVMNVFLTANGMSDQIGYTALAAKALTSNLSDPNSLANTLTDTRWKTLSQTYNFAKNGLSSIQNSTAIANIANQYVQAVWQKNEDTVTPGLSNALAFQAKASSMTTVDQILGDPTVRTVVTTALGVPAQIAFQDLNAQQLAITSRLDIAKLQDPKFVQNLAVQYLINNSTSASATSTPDLTTLAIQGQGLLA